MVYELARGRGSFPAHRRKDPSPLFIFDLTRHPDGGEALATLTSQAGLRRYSSEKRHHGTIQHHFFLDAQCTQSFCSASFKPQRLPVKCLFLRISASSVAGRLSLHHKGLQMRPQGTNRDRQPPRTRPSGHLPPASVRRHRGPQKHPARTSAQGWRQRGTAPGHAVVGRTWNHFGWRLGLGLVALRSPLPAIRSGFVNLLQKPVGTCCNVTVTRRA